MLIHKFLTNHFFFNQSGLLEHTMAKPSKRQTSDASDQELPPNKKAEHPTDETPEFICPFCFIEFDTLRLLEKHIANEHPEDGGSSKTGGKTFVKVTNLNVPTVTIVNSTPGPMTSGKQVPSTTAAHGAKNPSGPIKNQSNKTTKDNNNSTARSKPTPQNNDLLCSRCKITFNVYKDLQNHSCKTHPGNKSSSVRDIDTSQSPQTSYGCTISVCNKTFHSEALLKLHIEDHPQCHICKKRFINTGLFETHLTLHHLSLIDNVEDETSDQTHPSNPESSKVLPPDTQTSSPSEMEVSSTGVLSPTSSGRNSWSLIEMSDDNSRSNELTAENQSSSTSSSDRNYERAIEEKRSI